MRKPETEIRSSRQSKGITIEQLAAWTDIPVPELVLIENGFRQAQAKQLFLLATILNIPHETLNVSLTAVEDELQAQRETPEKSVETNVPERTILIIGPYYPHMTKVNVSFDNTHHRLRVKTFPSASQLFFYFGVGAAHPPESTTTPAMIILDTDINQECYQGTSRTLHSVSRLKDVPVFLSGQEEPAGLKQLSENTSVYGHIKRPATPTAYKAQLLGLLDSVDHLNTYL
ncbi:helix-turn-helix domain-containing protein [Parvularcula sp. IMCC14364]|uniref:helix-turn-helix domain-containing protein n=1 Tax=Parvularcula sp. IMCC14364 TaxID=3067902 RepID=UPI0027420E55|nr:helix-turn-helix transcriptional regulator [Parvularcula sp. IMCC14364]